MHYRVNRIDYECNNYQYSGYIDGEYAGFVAGYERRANTFDIRYSELEKQFRGTKAVSAFSGIINAVQIDYDYVIYIIDNKNNDALKIALSAGFHIIGVMTDGSGVSIELLKTKEGI